MLTTGHTCGRREAVDKSGEQPEGQPNRLATMTGSKRPRVLPKRHRERRGEEERDRQNKQCNENTLHLVLTTATPTAAAATAAATAAVRLQ